MAQTIKIKRSTSTSAPGSLTAGELAYSDASDKLFIGQPSDNAVTVSYTHLTLPTNREV